MSGSPAGGGAQPLSGALNLAGATLYVGQAVGSVAAGVFGVLSAIASTLPIIVIGIVLTAAMLPWVRYGDRAIEQAELGMRTVVYPIYRDFLRDAFDLIRRIYNGTICWFNGGSWWGYGMVREVLFPTLRECGVKPLIVAIANFIPPLGEDILFYIASGDFLTRDADFSAISPAGIAIFQAWIDLYTCSCSDLGDLVRTLPIVNPLLFVPPAWPMWAILQFFSGEWTDPQTWCAIEHTFNAVMAIFREVIQLAAQVVTFLFGNPPPGTVFIRPDLRQILNRICPAISCALRSTENAFQVVWDRYIPFVFNFTDYLCILDSLACIILKTIGLLVRILINIDQAVTYPDNPFWEAVIKHDVIELINRWATPTKFDPIAIPELPNPVRYTLTSYYLDTASQNTPMGVFNPVYQQKRLTECICTFITRTICDPSDTSTGCYSQGAQNLLMGLDFCCLTTNVFDTLADATASLMELSFHFSRGSDDFFLYIDNQPFSSHFKVDLVKLARCILSFFGLIPVVGTAIRDLIVGIIDYILSMIDFLWRVLVGLLTLPYYIIVLPSIPNFVTKVDQAIDFFIQIHENVIADTPTSIKNTLCVILNNGFPIPPIPCGECVVSGFVPPAAFKRRTMFGSDPTTKPVGPWELMHELWGLTPGVSGDGPHHASFHITPLIRYDNHTTNPFVLFNMMRVNVKSMDSRSLPYPTLGHVDEFVNEKHKELKVRWDRIRTCQNKHDTGAVLMRENPRLYEQMRKRGEFSCNAKEPMMPPYKAPPMWINPVREEEAVNMTERSFTLGPTVPPIVGCTPKPPCFDLCCIFRSLLVLIVHIIELLARFINGLVQYNHTDLGTMQDFPYFTGESANYGKATFESDIVALILDVFKPIKCLCEVLNLIIPVTPTGADGFTQGRPDICCFIQRISELIAAIFQTVVNAINSLAMGATTDFIYFRGGFFKSDVNSLFDITLACIECLCLFVQAIFPLNYIPGFNAAVDFDICCAAKAILDTIVEILRGVLQVIISLATITIDKTSYCYWRLDYTYDPLNNPTGHECGGTLDKIGLIVQLDVIIDTFLPLHGQDGGACLRTCNSDNGASGIVPCICQIFNTLVPWRDHPDRPVNCSSDPLQNNCQKLDFCCPFSKLGFLIADSLKFITRGMAALWQSWEPGLPEFFVHYIWCDEGTPSPCLRTSPEQTIYQIQIPNACGQIVNKEIPVCAGAYPVINSTSQVNYRCGEFTCGKVNIVFADLTDPFEGLISKCTCQFVSLLDNLLALLFNLIKRVFPFAGWSCCFCGGYDPQTEMCNINNANLCTPGAASSGVLPAASYIVQAVLVALTGLFRKFPLSCYWKPALGFHPNSAIPAQVEETWIFSFAGPTANALCVTVGNLACFVQSMFLLPQRCLEKAQRFLGGTVRWAAEVIFRVIGFIEAFVASFIQQPNTCIGSTCDQKPGSKVQSTKGVSAKPLGNMLVILLSIPIDILIGDADVACTQVCPWQFAVPAPDPCGCWNTSPNPLYAGSSATKPFVLTTNLTECIGKNYTNPTGPLINVGANFGEPTRCCKLAFLIPGTQIEGPLPVCQSPDDAMPGDIGYPGSCAVLSACRPDALPSCANDPMMPIGLSARYVGALDGIVMALTRYFRCMLNNLFCAADGTNCAQLGIIFYPAILIFSISWQILGGVIRFVASTIIFFFSLFTPPSGGACQCWEHEETDGYGMSGTRFYRQISAGLCYPCNILRYKCAENNPIGTVTNNDCSKFINPCRPYCPVNVRKLNPGFTEAQAIANCEAQWLDWPDKHNGNLTAAEVCSGHLLPKVLTSISNPGTIPCTCPWAPSATASSCSEGILNPPSSCPNCTLGDNRLYFLLDMCPDPNCQFNAPTQSQCDTMVDNFWPCFQGPFDCSYPAGSVVTCGGLQIISNFLDIFDAFVAIFTTPILIPLSARHMSAAEMMRSWKNLTAATKRLERPIGPVRREPIQVFKARFAGTTYGAKVEGANFAQSVTAALFDYDTGDCYDDVTTCACRNLDMPDHCYLDPTTNELVFPAKRKRGDNSSMTTAELTAVLAQEQFVGTTVCDHNAMMNAGATWENMTLSQKNLYVECLDKRTQGSRLHTLSAIIPADIMYNTHAPMNMMSGMFEHSKRALLERHLRKREDSETQESEFDRLFPKFHEELYNRTVFAHHTIEHKYGVPRTSIMFDAIVKADLIQYKWNRGYYAYALEKTMDGLLEGRSFLPTPAEALVDVKYALEDLKRIMWNQDYRKTYHATTEAASFLKRWVGEVLDEGTMKYMGRHYDNHWQKRKVKVHARGVERANEFVEAMKFSPIYKWWMNEKKEPRLYTPFANHISNVVAFQRQHWQNASFNFFNADLKLWSAKDILLKRWSNPVWRPGQLENWDKVKRVYYQMYDRIWPGVLPHDVRERFLFMSNCVVADRMANITIKVVDYCANEWMANVNFKRVDGGGGDGLAMRGVSSYFRHTSPYRENTYYGYKNRNKFVETKTVPSDPHSWIRPRLILPNATERLSHKVDYRVYRRMVTLDQERHGPAGWNLMDQILVWMEDLSGIAFGARADTWFDEIRAWLTNPNTDIADYPNVGLAYAVRFSFVCHFPESFNCSIGVGFETAFLWVTLGVIGAAVIGAVLLPIITLPLQILGWGISYWLILSAVAWHFPAACMIMSPSFPIPFGFGLPMCFMDELMAFFDKWITNCYSPLIIPPYMIAGEVCPTDPNQAIDFINCRDIGVSDGIQNLLYLGFWILGQGFVDFMLQVTSTWIGTLIPGLDAYMRATLNDFVNSSATNRDRLTFCFFMTLPTMLLPLGVLLIGGIAGALIVPPILLLINAIITWFMATPAVIAIPGGDASAWFGANVGEAEPEIATGNAPQTLQQRIIAGVLPSNLRQRIVPTAAGVAAGKEKDE